MLCSRPSGGLRVWFQALLTAFFLLANPCHAAVTPNFFPCFPGSPGDKLPFCDHTRSVAERVQDMISRMSDAEKIAQLNDNMGPVPSLGWNGYVLASTVQLKTSGQPPTLMPYYILRQPPGEEIPLPLPVAPRSRRRDAMLNLVASRYNFNTECLHGLGATCLTVGNETRCPSVFAAPPLLGSTFNRTVPYNLGVTIGDEVRPVCAGPVYGAGHRG